MATKAELTEMYITIRDRMAARKAEFDAADNADRELQRKIELVLLAKMDADGETSAKTPYGTAFIQTTDFASVAQRDDFMTYVKQHDAFDLLETRCSKTGVRSFIEENGVVPPGINYGTRREVMVRRPSKKRAGKGVAEVAELVEEEEV